VWCAGWADGETCDPEKHRPGAEARTLAPAALTIMPGACVHEYQVHTSSQESVIVFRVLAVAE
jgi:hypothetical protein